MALAETYAATGENYAAVVEWESALALGGPDAGVQLKLARAYDALGEFEVAADRLQANAPPSSPRLMAISQAYLKLGDFERSAGALAPLRKHWTDLADDARQAVVRAQLLAGDVETAKSLLPANATDPEWLDLTGLAAIVGGSPQSGVVPLQRATGANPNDSWSLYLLGLAQSLARHRAEALAAWSRAALLPDAPPDTVIGAAKLLAESGKLDEADRMLDRAPAEARKSPDYWDAAAAIAAGRKHAAAEQTARGYAAYNGGDPWGAEAIWRAAVKTAPPELAHDLYAAMYESATRREDAATALNVATEALNRWPNDPYFLRSRAEMLLGQGVLADARKFAEQYRSIAPQEQQARAAELLSRIALDSGQAALLQESAATDRKLAPNDPLPLLHLAEWQGQQGHDTANLEKTLDLYRQASALAPNNAEALARAGSALVDLKRTDEAVTTLLHALTLDTRVLDGVPCVLLARLYQQMGLAAESAFENGEYARIHKMKESWPTLLKALRQVNPPPSATDWEALGTLALQRRENWIALCAFTRETRMAPGRAAAWRGLGATQKRFGWFYPALVSMRRGRKN
jgi:tetratricopeptide (TPR) repeat protein